jgi:16S rRNA processing protein RimM
MVVARLLRARGIKGELAAFPLTEHPERLKTVYVRDAPLEVERAWMHKDRLILKFRGVDTRNDAEKLEGAEVSIPSEERPPAPDGEYYLSDLVGCEVFDATRRIGVVTGWQDHGGTPLLEVDNLLIPFARSICVEIDVEARRIRIDPPEGLLDLLWGGAPAPQPAPRLASPSYKPK